MTIMRCSVSLLQKIIILGHSAGAATPGLTAYLSIILQVRIPFKKDTGAG